MGDVCSAMGSVLVTRLAAGDYGEVNAIHILTHMTGFLLMEVV